MIFRAVCVEGEAINKRTGCYLSMISLFCLGYMNENVLFGHVLFSLPHQTKICKEVQVLLLLESSAALVVITA